VVGAVTNGRALTEAAERLKPDVIVADINMPQLNGLEALESLRRQNPGVKAIFLTVNEDVDTASDAIRHGACGYVLKKAASSAPVSGRYRQFWPGGFISRLPFPKSPSVYSSRARKVPRPGKASRCANVEC
jgi:DNA-binding NarL/FixJ family response regulator